MNRYMIPDMGSRATVLLKERPTDVRCAEIAHIVAEDLGDGKVSWFISDTIPEGYPVHLVDQLSAMKRDRPGSVYLTVTVLEPASEG